MDIHSFQKVLQRFDPALWVVVKPLGDGYMIKGIDGRRRIYTAVPNIPLGQLGWNVIEALWHASPKKTDSEFSEYMRKLDDAMPGGDSERQAAKESCRQMAEDAASHFKWSSGQRVSVG